MSTELIPYHDAVQDVTIIDDAEIEITQSREYGPDLAMASYVAEARTGRSVFKTYYDEECSQNTRARHKDDLACFRAFLAGFGIVRSVEDLYHDAEAWRGITYGLVRDFVTWMTEQEYAAGTINARLYTIRKYCQLAGPAPDGAGVLSTDTLTAILTVKGRSQKAADNIDEERQRRGLATRRGAKKARAIDITTAQALTLKKASLACDGARQHERRGSRHHRS